MNPAINLPSQRLLRHSSRPLMVFTGSVALVLAAGCGGGAPGSSTPLLTGNTSVVLLAASTANDQLSKFQVSFNSLTLTSQSGKTVTVFSTPQNAEFMHLNGSAEPLFTASIPQDVYTSATASIQQAYGVCVGNDSSTGGLVQAEFGGLPYPATINVSDPITITGSSMGKKIAANCI
jgi:hypothetical protein